MHQLELLDGGVSSLDVLDGVKETGILTKGARDGAESADVLGMAPPGVVAPAITVGDEGCPHSSRGGGATLPVAGGGR